MVEEVWLQHNDRCVVFDVEGRLDVKDIAKVWNLDPSSLVIASRRVKIGEDGLSTRSIDDFRGVEEGRDGRSQEKALTVEGRPSAVDDVRVKRRRLDPKVSCSNVLQFSTDRRTKLLKCLEDQINKEFLWNTCSVLTLPHISIPERSYTYIGRQIAKKMYLKVEKLGRSQKMFVVGAKGSGKSTISQAMASFFIANGQPAVYFSAEEFIYSPVTTMLFGLNFASSSEQSFWEGLGTLEQIRRKVENLKDHIYFFVDDWDVFEGEQSKELERTLHQICAMHSLIQINSTNSQKRIRLLQSDKNLDRIQIIDGPYTEEELKTWVAQSGLDVNTENFWIHLDYWTGGMPRLLKYYAEGGSNNENYKQMLEVSYVEKLKSKLVDLAKDRAQLLAILDFVTAGTISVSLPRGENNSPDLTCFYWQNSKWCSLCPYLKATAEALIIEKASQIDKLFNQDELVKWAKVVSDDLKAVHVSWPRVGWNVESLVLNVLKCKKHVFNDLLPYAECMEYENSSIPSGCSAGNLKNGVLMIPKLYYEECIDCAHIHWKDGKYMVTGIQISVGGWKGKQRKASHSNWNAEPWKHEDPQEAELVKRYIYFMPQAPESGDGFMWKKFGDICPSLAFLNNMRLNEQENQEVVKQCSHKTKLDKQCGRRGRCKDNEAGFCKQHRVAVVREGCA